jgi:magnesium-transporting ATPase (P-type)
VGGFAALLQNDPGKSNGLMDMDAASKVKSTSGVSTWHAMTTDEVIKRLNTNAKKGLDAGEVATRLQKYGSNRLPEGTKRGPFMRFLSQFNNILGQRFHGSNHIRQPRRAYRTRCG